MNNIKLSLEMWGNWAHCRTGTEYSSVNITFHHLMPSAGSGGAQIDDREGMIIDAAVAGLRQYDVLAYKLVIAHYVYRISQNKLARELGKAQSYVANLLKVAEAFIAGQLLFYTQAVYAGRGDLS